jgi:hypothetical protein
MGLGATAQPMMRSGKSGIGFERRHRRHVFVQPLMGSVQCDGLECEWIDRCSFQSNAEARLALFPYIEGWYNPRPRHGARSAIDHHWASSVGLKTKPQTLRESGATPVRLVAASIAQTKTPARSRGRWARITRAAQLTSVA